jgi:indole-3-glycerol phosphate synthase
MTILDKIIEHKRKEVEEAKKRVSVKELMYYRHFDKLVPSLKEYILNSGKSGIIAEHKRRSPSKGIINDKVNVTDVVKGYEVAGASAVSVLTDSEFFGGSNDDLTTARDAISIPILRKDFIIDPYQVYEAKAIGASAILLIAAVLTPGETKELGSLASYLGMEVLMEFHDESELDRMNSYVDAAGINNRNLKTFEVDLNKSVELAEKLPADIPKVAESGISSVEDILFLRSKGFSGFLIGENFMKNEDPGKACEEFSLNLQ